MSVFWLCNRCAKKYTDVGVKFSNLPADWTAYYLSEVFTPGPSYGTGQATEDVKQSFHLCETCTDLSKRMNKSPRVIME